MSALPMPATRIPLPRNRALLHKAEFTCILQFFASYHVSLHVSNPHILPAEVKTQ